MFRAARRGRGRDHRVAACSTVPAALRRLRTMLGRYYGDRADVIVEPGVRTGVQLAIDNPRRSAPTGW
jgi:pantothenate kinase type III